MHISESPQSFDSQHLPAVRIPALEYHDTQYKGGAAIEMRPEWFLDQMKWLSDNRFVTLTGEELIRFVRGESRPVKKSCVLRFDLGLPRYRDCKEVILPALNRYSLHALFFVRTSMIKDGDEDDFHRWDELREWERDGLIEVGSHSVHHPNYRKIPAANRLWDARESKQVIESKLGHPISLFAFPYDSVPDSPDLLLRPLGYALGLAGPRNERSILFEDPDPYALPCYYPYSSQKAYPSLTTASGKTFEQMMLAAVADGE